MRIKLTLDRFEGEFAVCIDDDDNTYDIPKNIVADLSEGDIFTIVHDGTIYSSPLFLEEETKNEKEKLQARLNRLFKK